MLLIKRLFLNANSILLKHFQSCKGTLVTRKKMLQLTGAYLALSLRPGLGCGVQITVYSLKQPGILQASNSQFLLLVYSLF